MVTAAAITVINAILFMMIMITGTITVKVMLMMAAVFNNTD